jgi:hypothetical protein
MFTFFAFPSISIIVLIFAILYSLDTENDKKLRAAEAISVLMCMDTMAYTIALIQFLNCSGSQCTWAETFLLGSFANILVWTLPAIVSFKYLKKENKNPRRSGVFV